MVIHKYAYNVHSWWLINCWIIRLWIWFCISKELNHWPRFAFSSILDHFKMLWSILLSSLFRFITLFYIILTQPSLIFLRIFPIFVWRIFSLKHLTILLSPVFWPFVQLLNYVEYWSRWQLLGGSLAVYIYLFNLWWWGGEGGYRTPYEYWG